MHCKLFFWKTIPYFAYEQFYLKTADEDRVLSCKDLKELILKKNKDKIKCDSQTNKKFNFN